jgi:hypothetical protein
VSTSTIHVGDALAVLRTLPSESVQCCVTSPPYWGLRDYGVDGQIGLETTPQEFIARLVAVFEEVRGPIGEVGVNGVTHEALLAILIDRMQAFQKGPYSCRENALALTKLEEAVHWLNARTARRTAQGVEGTHSLDPKVTP